MATTPIKKKFTFSVRDFYAWFQRGKKESKEDTKITYATYKKVVELFFIAVMKKMIKEGLNFKFPYKMGMFFVKAYPQKKGYIRVYERKTKTIKVIPGVPRYKFKWFKETAYFPNKPFYIFKPLTSPKDDVARAGLGRHIFDTYKDPMKSRINL
jgi:hypothetical protein